MNQQRGMNLNVADAVGITAVQYDTITGNFLVLLQIENISHVKLGRSDFNNHIAA